MPIYEYDCKDCGHTTETLRRMAEADAPIACESCGGTKTARGHSVFAAGGSGAASETPLPMGGCSGPTPMGGCCGGMCGMQGE